MRNITVEICAGSVIDCIEAKMAGSTRVELNSALHMGGLTATFGTLSLVKEYCPGLNIVSMLRPRGAGFCYSNFEFESMKRDAIALLRNGSNGIVFGFLNEDRTIDTKRTKALCDLAKTYNKEAVFHRAFDLTANRDDAIEKLIEIGIDRVLTSGGASDCVAGIEEIKRLESIYGGEIEILPGGGIRAENAKEIIEKTGVRQIHSSCRGWSSDSTSVSETLNFGYKEDHPLEYERSDPELIKALLESVKGL